jgi:hypothetical protein
MTSARNGAATVAPARAKRSGTVLTEAERASRSERTDRLSLRLRPGYVARLRALADEDGYSAAEWIETFVDTAESEIAEFREQRPAKRAAK